MIINSQFFITYYAGKTKLSLKTVPENLTSRERAEYDRFIQSVSSIYGSQSLNGKIPKFWTKLVESSDALGNDKYSYTPHPDSDLEYLDPKSAYYFIVRDESAIPLKIPVIGGSLLGFTNTQQLPNVTSDSIPNVLLTVVQGNSVVISPTIENLQPYEEYKYEFKSVDSNWPVSIKSISGILKPSTSSGTIKAKATFCPTSGSCDTDVLDYTLPQVGSFTYDSDKYAIMELSIKPVSYDGPEIFSNQFNLSCKDCLPKSSISLSNISSPIVNRPADLTTNASYSFNISINNLFKDQVYTYNIETINAQWPVIFIGPSSGTIDVKSVTTVPAVTSKILFCHTTGMCRPGENGVNNYSVPSYTKFWTGAVDYDVVLRASLVSSSSPSEIIYSNPLMVTYRKAALAAAPAATISIKNDPIILPTTTTTPTETPTDTPTPTETPTATPIPTVTPPSVLG